MKYANPHAVTSVAGQTYTYDNNGNLTSAPDTSTSSVQATYAWDYRNRLIQAGTGGGAPSTSYLYDDARSADWLDWSWYSTRNFNNTNPVYRGAKSLKVIYTQAWGGLSPAAPETMKVLLKWLVSKGHPLDR